MSAKPREGKPLDKRERRKRDALAQADRDDAHAIRVQHEIFTRAEQRARSMKAMRRNHD